MNPAPKAPVKLTYDDLMLFPDDGKRHEIIDGVHYVTPSPNTKHQVVAGNLHLALGSYLKAQPIGVVFFAPFDVLFSQFDVVEPDLLYISRARRDVLTDKNVQGAPDLVVEILSPGTRKRDTTLKGTLYERGGVQEYWVVDPRLDRIRVFRRTDDVFVSAAELLAERGDALTSPLFPGLSVPLAEIFAPAL